MCGKVDFFCHMKIEWTTLRFLYKGEMVCSGGYDEMGKQMAADYCIPEKNGDW